MTSSDELDRNSLVDVSAAENTFMVPATSVNTVDSTEPLLKVGNTALPAEVFDRDTLLDEYTISSTDSAYINILGDYDLFYRYMDNPLIKSYLSPFGQVQFGLVVTVRLIAPGSCYGLYNIQALCDGGYVTDTLDQEFDNAVDDAYPNSTQDVHSFLNVDMKNDVVLELPWESMYDSVHTNVVNLAPPSNKVRCWRLLIWALAPIQNTLSNTVANGRIQIYARMTKERSFENLVFQGKKKKGIHELYPASKDMVSENHAISDVASSLSKGVSKIGGMFPAIAPYATPIASGLAAVSSVADWFGFTRESTPQAPTTTTRRLFSSLPPADGEDSGEILALSVANATSIDPSLGGGTSEDPMSYASLFERWTIVDVFDMDESSTGIVRNLPVTPYLCGSILGVDYPTTGGWVGTTFSQWRGGMEYLIYIPSSANVQGSLQVLWDPRQTGSPTSGAYSYDPTNRLTNVVIDLKGTSRTLVAVDYSQPDPCLESVFIRSGESFFNPKCCNGCLVFKINAPPTAPRITGYSIKVIVMARPAQDMKFGVPTSTYRVHEESLADEYEFGLNDIRYQSGEDESQDSTTDMFVKLSNSSYDYPTKDLLWGEEFKSVRALVQHPTAVARLSTSGVVGFSVYRLPHFIPPRVASATARWDDGAYATPASAPFNWQGFYSAAFVGQRGSMRLKVWTGDADESILMMPMPNSSEVPMLVASLGAEIIPVPGLVDQQLASARAGAEVVIPYYGERKYHQPRYLPLTSDPKFSSSRFNVIGSTRTVDFPTGFVYAAAGPDYTVTRFRRIPGMIIRTS